MTAVRLVCLLFSTWSLFHVAVQSDWTTDLGRGRRSPTGARICCQQAYTIPIHLENISRDCRGALPPNCTIRIIAGSPEDGLCVTMTTVGYVTEPGAKDAVGCRYLKYLDSDNLLSGVRNHAKNCFQYSATYATQNFDGLNYECRITSIVVEGALKCCQTTFTIPAQLDKLSRDCRGMLPPNCKFHIETGRTGDAFCVTIDSVGYVVQPGRRDFEGCRYLKRLDTYNLRSDIGRNSTHCFQHRATFSTESFDDVDYKCRITSLIVRPSVEEASPARSELMRTTPPSHDSGKSEFFHPTDTLSAETVRPPITAVWGTYSTILAVSAVYIMFFFAYYKWRKRRSCGFRSSS